MSRPYSAADRSLLRQLQGYCGARDRLLASVRVASFGALKNMISILFPGGGQRTGSRPYPCAGWTVHFTGNETPILLNTLPAGIGRLQCGLDHDEANRAYLFQPLPLFAAPGGRARGDPCA